MLPILGIIELRNPTKLAIVSIMDYFLNFFKHLICKFMYFNFIDDPLWIINILTRINIALILVIQFQSYISYDIGTKYKPL